MILEHQNLLFNKEFDFYHRNDKIQFKLNLFKEFMINDFGLPLTQKQQEVLNKLIECRSAGEGISVRGIAGELDISPSLVSYTIKQFEKRGIVRRNPYNPNDFNIILSPQPKVFYANLIEARCGGDGCLNEDNIIEKVPIAMGQFSIVNPDRVILVKAKGDSMEPKIFEGDLVLTEKINDGDYHSNRTYLVINDNEAMIKKYCVLGSGKFLVSSNPSYNPIPIAENTRIVAEVKGILRNKSI